MTRRVNAHPLEAGAGRGAMGIVWRAQDRRTGRAIAVKSLDRAADGRHVLVTDGLDPARIAEAMPDGVVRWLRAETAVRPVVLVREHLRRADPTSLDHVDPARGALAGRPLFVIGVARLELDAIAVGLCARPLDRNYVGERSPRAADALARLEVVERARSTTIRRIAVRGEGARLFRGEMVRAARAGGDDPVPPSLVAIARRVRGRLAASRRRGGRER